jgi:dihydropyrimidine dehydrogenase (NAD+) subunit PreA
MPNLAIEICGLRFKNPIISASDEFGGTARMAKRAIDQGVSGIITKTIHQIPGPQRWTRPHMFPLRKFGKGFEDVLYTSLMFSHIPYEDWLKREGPAIRNVCHENDVRFIVSISGIGEDFESWVRLARDQEAIGAEMLELNLGGPHATFGAEESARDVGAPIGLDPEKAYNITNAVVKVASIPVICKMTPVSSISEVALACESAGAAAISANNSCYGIFIDHETGTCYGVPCIGGFSMGRGWLGFSLAKVIEITKTIKLPVLGIGGVFTYEDAVRYIMAGCPLVQVSNAKFQEGIRVLRKIINGLEEYMERKGYTTINDFIGVALKDVTYLRDYPREEQLAPISPIIPQFDMELCNSCDICERLCPYEAIYRTEQNIMQVNREYCFGCGLCVGVCPKNAIKLVHTVSGETIWEGRGLFKQWVTQ